MSKMNGYFMDKQEEAYQAGYDAARGEFCGFKIVVNPNVPEGEIWIMRPSAAADKVIHEKP